MDIGLKIGLGLALAAAGGSAIVLPDERQKEVFAMHLFDRPMRELTPQESNTAEFAAGHYRWKNFVEDNVYKWTRQLPGASNPIRNPYEAKKKVAEEEAAAKRKEAQVAANAKEAPPSNLGSRE